MTKYAGVAQRPERQAPILEVAGSNPAPRSTPAEAFAAGLNIDPASRDVGFQHGLEGDAWTPPPGADLISYALGHIAGVAQRRGQPG